RVEALRGDRVQGMLGSVDAWSAVKLYLWFDRPWWRDDAFLGMRVTTDLPPRKLFTFDEAGLDGPAILLAAYADGRAVERWAPLADGGAPGAAASPAILDAAAKELRAVFPSIATIPAPVGSAFKHWGADPLECGWHYWRAGADSVRVIADIAQPSPGHELYICGEAYSRWQAWVEGALETGATVVERLTASSQA
ncbi:MAG: hypothetical protein QOD78_1436, partial [Chloroflexota bacterium]|nr:hypothetical protein [Chloroflexota bacterium]